MRWLGLIMATVGFGAAIANLILGGGNAVLPIVVWVVVAVIGVFIVMPQAGYVALFLVLTGSVFAWYALTAPPFLDEAATLERAMRSPWSITTPGDYFHAIDHPALFHWVDSAVLKISGVKIGRVPRVDLTKDYKWNVTHGLIAPREPIRILRIANVVALVGAMTSFFFLARFLFGGCLWGFLVAVPLVIPDSIGQNVGGYVKTDSYLALFLAVSLYVWVRLHYSDRSVRFRGVLVMGLLAGLTVSTKLNGGLLLLAYLTYLLVLCRGLDRIWYPFVFCLLSFTVFVLVNPVFQSGGIDGLFFPLRDMLQLRAKTLKIHEQMFGHMTIPDRLLYMFPHWYLMPALALLVSPVRNEKWFLPVSLWSSFLILGTAITVQQRFSRYLMPINFGLTVIVIFSAVTIALKLSRKEMQFVDLFRERRRF